MNRKQFDYFDEDGGDLPGPQPGFQVPWYARITDFLFAVGIRFRMAIDAVAEMFLRAFQVDRIVRLYRKTIDLSRFGLAAATWKCLSFLRLERVLRPFQVVFHGIRQAIDWLLLHTIFSHKTETVLEKSGGVFKHVHVVVAYAKDRVALWLEKSAVFRWLTLPIRLVVAPIIHFFVFWLFSREYRRVWLGIPAVLLMIPLGIGAVVIPLRTEDRVVRQYMAAARKAAKDEQFDAARLYYRKAMSIESGQMQAIREIALLADQEGDPQEAYQQMRKLASEHEPGLPSAHLWIAHAIATGRIDPGVEDSMKLMKTHLDHVLAIDPDHDVALRLVADYYLTVGDPESCLRILETVKTPNRQARLSLQLHKAIATKQLGNTTAANRMSREVADLYTQMMSSKETLDANDYVVLATAKKLLGDLQDAREIVEEARTHFPEHEALTLTDRDLRIEALKMLRTDKREFAVEWFEMAQRTLQLDTDNERILLGMAELTRDPFFVEKVYAIVDPRIADNSLPLPVIDRLANAATYRSDGKNAIRLYQIILDHNPNRLVALNNIAWFKAQEEHLDLEEAVQLIEKAMVIDPDDPFVRSTRGHILVRTGRFAEAIKDLEFALNGIPGNTNIHSDLALAYSEIGNAEMAAKHQSMIRN